MWPFSRKADSVSESKSLTDPTSESWEALVGAFTLTTSGVAVNADSAMAVPAVNCAVNLIAGAVGMLPAKIYRQQGEGKEPAPDHPGYALIHDEANAWQSAGKVRELVTIDAVLHGDGFAFANKVAGKPVELLHLPRSSVTVERLDTGEPRFKVGEVRYRPDQILHIQAPSLDGRTGLGLLRSGREAIGLAILLERTSARLFKNNSRPGGILTMKGQASAKTVERVGLMWKAMQGGDNIGGVAVVDQDGDYKPIAFTSIESQHHEQRNFSIGEISRLTRVPITLLQELSKGTFANTEQQNLQFLQLCLLYWLKAWTDAYRRCLLTKDERSTHSISFVVDDLLRADTAARAGAYAQFRSAGVMTSNDCRRRENLPPLPDGDTLASPYTTPGPANSNEPKEQDDEAA
ncbi:MAG: phage portal protein [Bosea sp.]|uniref:phage portal protein n=1 Tax=Bosea sp. (in: a-proteobacteria) TaxID=1871050 RepID=UPI001AD600C6|nr:phage portal protein [Bosea sp. (in: a-proteobacteria)]MBN9470205.1 phage portal protein [Bosea sp. (in: a-proteobacteria)]